jgi:hypothetical protein
MPLDDSSHFTGASYPNIVPQNNQRLPDALTIKHGPARLLARFVLEGDKVARQRGIELRLRHDFDELLYHSKSDIATKTQFRLMNMFNPEFTSELSPDNSYWICGTDRYGDIVLTQAGRVYYWPDSTLEDEARLMFYGGKELGQHCVVTAPDAKKITGVTFYGGQGWVRPDFRGRHVSRLFPRLGRAYAFARWPIDWSFSFVAPILVEKGVAEGYGYRHLSPSIVYPDTQWGRIDAVLVSLAAGEAYDDFADFLADEMSGLDQAEPAGLSSRDRVREESVTRTSSELVFHGSRSRS